MYYNIANVPPLIFNSANGFLLFNIYIGVTLLAQAQGVIQSYIISIENGKVYLDITVPKAQVGDVLSVYEKAGYIVHPVTKKKIKKEGVKNAFKDEF